SIRRIVQVLDGHFSTAKDADVGHGLVRYGEPERPALVVVVNEVNTLNPERRIFCRLTFNPNDGVFVSVHPDSAPCEIFVLALGLNREDERRATPDVLPTDQLKRVILRCNAGLLAKTRTRGLGFGFEQSRENVLPCTPP